MGPSGVIPQAVYDDAVGRLLSTVGRGLDLDAFRAIYLLHQTADAAREFSSRESLEHFNLTWTQFEVLWNIWIFGEREAGWVARAALVSKSGLTTILTRLERRGLVVRSPHPTDGRKMLVRLSEEGDALMRQVFSRLNAAESRFAQPLDRERRRQLIGLLDALLAGSTAKPPSGVPGPSRRAVARGFCSIRTRRPRISSRAVPGGRARSGRRGRRRPAWLGRASVTRSGRAGVDSARPLARGGRRSAWWSARVRPK